MNLRSSITLWIDALSEVLMRKEKIIYTEKDFTKEQIDSIANEIFLAMGSPSDWSLDSSDLLKAIVDGLNRVDEATVQK